MISSEKTEYVDYAMVTTPHKVEGMYALAYHTKNTAAVLVGAMEIVVAI